MDEWKPLPLAERTAAYAAGRYPSIGPGRSCSPRHHPTNYEPLLLELNGIVSHGEQHMPGPREEYVIAAGTGLVTSIFGVYESVRIRPNPTLYRIRPNPECFSVGSRCPYRLHNTAKETPAGLLVIRPSPLQSDPLPNPSESGNAIPGRE